MYISKDNANRISKRYMHSHVHFSITYIAKMWKQPKSPLKDEWIKKLSHTHTHTEEYYSVMRKEILATTWINLEGI